jgi:hypothetical protein
MVFFEIDTIVNTLGPLPKVGKITVNEFPAIDQVPFTPLTIQVPPS